MGAHSKGDKAEQDRGRFSGDLSTGGGAHRDGSPDTTDWSKYPAMPEAPSQKYDQG